MAVDVIATDTKIPDFARGEQFHVFHSTIHN
jgi:hypothetical protein